MLPGDNDRHGWLFTGGLLQTQVSSKPARITPGQIGVIFAGKQTIIAVQKLTGQMACQF